MGHLNDCAKCMQTTTAEQRRMIGCGFEPAHPSAQPWRPPLGAKGYQHDLPTICVGYSSNLPEVSEALLAHRHWTNGAIDAFCQGEPPTEHLLDLIAIADGERAAVEAWLLTPKKNGGGGE